MDIRNYERRSSAHYVSNGREVFYMKFFTFDLVKKPNSTAVSLKEKQEFESEFFCLAGPADIPVFMCTHFSLNELANEAVWIICLNAHMCPVGVMQISMGGENDSPCYLNGIYTRVLLMGVTHFILVHNHPSGNAWPSMQDNELTSNLFNGSGMLGLRLLDHIIVCSENDYYSYKEHNYIIESEEG